jgi:hypothetical protein
MECVNAGLGLWVDGGVVVVSLLCMMLVGWVGAVDSMRWEGGREEVGVECHLGEIFKDDGGVWVEGCMHRTSAFS